jgi:serine/threonine protein kinase
VQLSVIQSLHSQHYIHYDIKPKNFMICNNYLPMDPTLFFVNFGLAQLFCDPATYLHISYTINHSTTGTLLFASINSQQGYAQSCHNDLESLAYTIIYSVLSACLGPVVL